jgi:anaerobic dimethyl sulfoxide reductase subunit B (iron-sulfur subunit)
MKKQYGFSFEADKCLKCWACEVACKQWHGIKAASVKLRRVVEVTSGAFPDVKRTFLSLSCRRCAKAPCSAVCPVGTCPTRALHWGDLNELSGLATMKAANKMARAMVLRG